MKNTLIGLLLFGAFLFQAQSFLQASEKPSVQVAETGLHQKRWEKISYATNRFNQPIATTNSFVELETGLHYFEEGQWRESRAEIELVPNGAAALKGQHKVIFSPNIDAEVAVDLQTSDGKQLKSRIYGLSYYDVAKGQSVLIAELKNSVGVLLPPNQVLYEDAFTDIKADVLYTYAKAGFEQFVILREQPPGPNEYGLNPETTQLEVMTEFFDAPIPVKKTRVIAGGIDEQLDFGAMKMGVGRAFTAKNDNTSFLGVRSSADPDSASVKKAWVQMENRTFLVESVLFADLQRGIGDLPQAQAALNLGKERVVAEVRIPKATSTKVQKAESKTAMRVAAADLKRNPGYVVDYTLVNGATDYTFQSDTTYYVSGEVSIFGTITLEGGTVIKFAPTNSASIHAEDGLFECKTAPYRPAVLTARDDDTVGEKISGSDGVPDQYLNGFSVISGDADLKHLRISYANYGASFWNGTGTNTLSDIQFVKNSVPINCDGRTMQVRNCLFATNSYTVFGYSYKISLENVTINGSNWLMQDWNGGVANQAHFTNCIVVGVTNIGTVATITTNFSLISTNTVPGIFQTLGAADHYLADGSEYRNYGTTNINSDLLASLRKKTTYPPIILTTNNVLRDTVLNPQAQRDVDEVDIGYHYDPLDYTIQNLAISAELNSLTLTNGVAVGFFGNTAVEGLILDDETTFRSEGSPTNLNRIVWYNTVQEQSNTNWNSSTTGLFVGPALRFDWQPTLTVHCRFTEFSSLNRPYYYFGVGGAFNGAGTWTLRDCYFGPGYVEIQSHAGCDNWYSYIGFTNNVFARSTLNIYAQASVSMTVDFYNNLFWNGTVYLVGADQYSLTFKDNLFDKTDLVQNSATVANDYNGYITGEDRWTPNGSNDEVLASSPAYESGALGNYYYPTNLALIDAGSQNADASGLYHYTTITANTKETNSVVDIGFHYIAVDGNGDPFDTDSDGSPDYYEDSNGNGSVNSGETHWESAEDLGLRVIITRPTSNSNLP